MKRMVLPSSEDEQPSHAAASTPPAERRPVERQRPRNQGQSLPPEVMEVLAPSFRVGVTAGACGLFVGAASGILRSAPTAFFSVIAGGQWFVLGSSYTAMRLVGLKYFGEGESTPRDKLKASTLAGGVAGTMGGLLRGPRNILPGAIVGSLLAAGGQAIFNRQDAKAASATPNTADSRGFWARWSPLTQLSDQDYEKILEEKLLRVEADIAVIDDHIKELREAASREGEVSKGNSDQLASSDKT